MHDVALDFVVMILILGVVVATGFNLIIPVIKTIDNICYNETYDKTVGKLEGDKYIDTFDGCIGSNDVILLAMGQTYFMPSPGILDIGGNIIEISDNISFSPNSLGVGTDAKSAINNWYSSFNTSSMRSKFKDFPTNIRNARFKVMYSGDVADRYSLFILLTRNNSTAEPEFFRCEPNGKVRDRGGKIV